MNLPPLPENLYASHTSKQSYESYYSQAFKLYEECIKKIKNGEPHFSLNSEDIPKEVLKAVK